MHRHTIFFSPSSVSIGFEYYLSEMNTLHMESIHLIGYLKLKVNQVKFFSQWIRMKEIVWESKHMFVAPAIIFIWCMLSDSIEIDSSETFWLRPLFSNHFFKIKIISLERHRLCGIWTKFELLLEMYKSINSILHVRTR